ncbi:MAG TPA: hypothetical protein VHS78_09940 [Candidatus Elarobacter sp.]|jgi:hypothetical protein|nr:hypothetical protein [Candidatus Elarobacter sp.]
MNRLTKTLALAAVVLAGAFGATAAQASANNFNVDFKIHDADASVSMIRITDPLPSGITGLITPASAIAAGGNDPSTGYAVWSGTLPGLNFSSSVSLVYGRASDGGSQCTFTMTVKHDSNVLPYLLTLSESGPACSVSTSSARTSDGQFTPSTPYQFNWVNTP